MATGNLSISYTPACSAADHHIEFGPLQDVSTYGYSGQECSIGTSGTYGSFDPGPDSYFFVVVGDDGLGVEGSYGTSMTGGPPVERPENLLDPVCTLVQDLSQRCDGPFSPDLDMVAYRPMSESYGNPLQRTAIAESDEDVPGAGIRVNGDDDDISGLPDRDETSVSSENDLVEVVLSVDPPSAPPGYEYVLTRSSTNIRVWNESSKITEIFGPSSA